MTDPGGVPAGRPGARLLRHAQWDLPEAVVVVVLVGLGLLVVAGVVAGLVEGVGGPAGLTGDQSAASALASATGWAVPVYAFVALAATGLLWWEVHTATAVVDGALALDEDRGDAADGGDDRRVLAAFDHLLRARTLATATVPVLMALVLGALGAVAGSFLAYRGSPAPAGGSAWSEHALVLGSGAAVWVVAGAGLVVALHLRTQVAHEFARAEHAAARERGLDRAPDAGGAGGA
ncbi:MAG TPA: hypothetical protein VLZ77_00325 [Acidimicrobiales bacterium]|nr:hypothetical protein [Acidimicrobiales bacterium]